MALNETAQAWQDDLDTWGDLSADVTMLDDGAPATDFHLAPEEVRVMFAALRDSAQGEPEEAEPNLAQQYADRYVAGITADMEREAPFGYVNQYDGTTAATLDEIDAYDADEHDADNLPENWEKAGAWDFLRDVLDIRYVVERDHSFRDAEICVALGGPNVWIHTATSEVVVHWGFDSARVHLPSSFTDALKDAAEEDWG